MGHAPAITTDRSRGPAPKRNTAATHGARSSFSASNAAVCAPLRGEAVPTDVEGAFMRTDTLEVLIDDVVLDTAEVGCN